MTERPASGGRAGGGAPGGVRGGEGADRERLERLGRRYVRAALFWLVLGLLLGAGMLLFGNDNLQFVHVHALLVGFVLFLAYGLGFVLIPSRSPSGVSIHSGWATVQFFLANAGLIGLLAGAVLPVGYGLDRIAALFGLVEAAAGVLFAVLAWKALRGM